MPMLPRISVRLAAACLLTLALVAPLSVSANDHGGGGAPEPMVFTLNLASGYVQFGLIFEGAGPEVAARVNAFKPRIQHQIILLMAGKDAAHLRTLEGKKELIEEIVEIANHVIGETEETGVHEVLFSKFLLI